MLLRDQCARDGEWLFRWRSYVPLVLAPVLVGSMFNFTYLGGSEHVSDIWQLACFTVSIIGLAIRCYAIGYAAPGTSGNSTRSLKAKSMNTTGAYSLIRHPLYVGSFFMWLGIAMFPHNAFVVIILTLFFWLYYERIMMAEEEFLRTKFPKAFSVWAASTPAVFPNFRSWKPPERPFSVRRILRREYSGMFAVVSIFTLLELIEEHVMEQRFEIELVWAALFVSSAALYIGLWTIKHHTRWLHG